MPSSRFSEFTVGDDVAASVGSKGSKREAAVAASATTCEIAPVEARSVGLSVTSPEATHAKEESAAESGRHETTESERR